jgi:hypothetical protein
MQTRPGQSRVALNPEPAKQFNCIFVFVIRSLSHQFFPHPVMAPLPRSLRKPVFGNGSPKLSPRSPSHLPGAQRNIYINQPLSAMETDHHGEPLARYARNKVRTSSMFHISISVQIRV